jgi:hypothetical protein
MEMRGNMGRQPVQRQAGPAQADRHNNHDECGRARTFNRARPERWDMVWK